MTEPVPTPKTSLAEWLFKNNITLREGGAFFKCTGAGLKNYADGTRIPTGETRELIASALLGEITVAEFRDRVANDLPDPQSNPVPGATVPPAAAPAAGGTFSGASA